MVDFIFVCDFDVLGELVVKGISYVFLFVVVGGEGDCVWMLCIIVIVLID